jgi:acetoin utilization deacetylase AcuC-like enzyme
VSLSGVALVEDARFLDHGAPGHPERPDRLRAISAAIAADAELSALRRVEPRAADDDALHLVHPPAHVAAVEAMGGDGGGWFDADTYCTPRSPEVARLAAGSAIALCDAVLEGGIHGLALVRPPGHHASAATAMGFCLYNNACVALRHAQAQGAVRVAVLDIDVHHGNGTQEILWDDASALYTSLHQAPFYPGSGAAGERGGHDNVINVPLAAGTEADRWLAAFDDRILPRVREWAADLIVVSAGYDAHRDDPLAELRLDSATYAAVATRVAEICADRGIGSLWLLEGGYDLAALADSVSATLHALGGDSPSATLPA